MIFSVRRLKQEDGLVLNKDSEEAGLPLDQGIVRPRLESQMGHFQARHSPSQSVSSSRQHSSEAVVKIH
jgi:hypothetical protein